MNPFVEKLAPLTIPMTTAMSVMSLVLRFGSLKKHPILGFMKSRGFDLAVPGPVRDMQIIISLESAPAAGVEVCSEGHMPHKDSPE